MSHKKSATDEEILDAYERTGSVWRAGELLGISGQSVHKRLVELGANTHVNVFTEEDYEYLEERYLFYRDAGKLQLLADEMGRTKQFICRKARDLGLTNRKRRAYWGRFWLDAPKEVMQVVWDDFKASDMNLREFCAERHYDVQHFIDAMNHHFGDEYDDVVVGKLENDNKPYARGMTFEVEVRDYLRSWDYMAFRSPASKTPIDIYCIKPGELVFVQCKLNKIPIRSEWNEIYDYCESVGATPVIANKTDGSPAFFEMLRRKRDDDNGHPMAEWHPTGERRYSYALSEQVYEKNAQAS